MFIAKEKIEYIRERASIEEIVMRYVPSLKKKGKDYVGLCPFHKEKTPSFTVSPEKKFFHCFGCNAGGNVFSFISKIENLEFVDSVLFLANYLGIEVEDERSSGNGSISELRRINLYAMKYYHLYLNSPEGSKGREYFLSRGVKEDAIEKFKLGFSPPGWDMLTKSLQKKRADMTLVEKAGLIGQTRDKHRYIDKFRGRAMFPIFDKSHHVIAFGGRVIEAEQQPKYLNSPDSEIFHKREILYGLNFAQPSIRENDRVIVVEGYLDVIGCHQNGIENVVAPLGTALTETQIKTLSRLCNEIVMLFDSDSAGINAALKSLETGSSLSTSIKIAALPEDDPFDYIQKRGVMELMVIIDNAKEPIQFQIDTVVNQGKGSDIVDLVRRIVPILESIELDTERNTYFRYAANLLGIDEVDLRNDFGRLRSKNRINTPSNSSNTHPQKVDYRSKLYRDLITLIIHYPEIMGDVIVDFSSEDIGDEIAKSIYLKMIEMYRDENILKIDKIFDFWSEGVEIDFLKDAFQRELKISNPKSAYTEIYVNLKLHSIDERLAMFTKMLRQSNDDKLDYLAEIEILRREKEKLKTYLYNKG